MKKKLTPKEVVNFLTSSNYKSVTNTGCGYPDGHQLNEEIINFVREVKGQIEKSAKNGAVKWNVAIIDDEIKTKDRFKKKFFNKLKNSLINQLKCDIDEINDPQDLWKKIKNNPSILDDYDVIFIDNFFQDISPPDYGVQKIIPEIQKRKHIKRFPLIIVITGSTQEEERVLSLQKGADWFIFKDDFYAKLEKNENFIIELIVQAYVTKYWKIDKDFSEIENIDEVIERFGIARHNISYEEYKYILEKIFSDVEDISKLKILGESSGLSGAKLAIVQPQKKDGTEILPRFIKIQDKDKLVNEKYAYDKRIKGLIDNFCGRIETPIAVTDNFAGIAYTGVGTIDNYKNGRVPEQFGDFINNKSLNQIKGALSIIFRTILNPLYQEIIPSDPSEKIHEFKKSRYFYRKFFPAYAELDYKDIKTTTDGKEFEIVRRKGNDVIVRYVNIEDKEDKNRDFYKSYIIKNFPDNILIRPGKKIKLKVDDKILKEKIEDTLKKKIFGEDFEKDLKLISENSKKEFIKFFIEMKFLSSEKNNYTKSIEMIKSQFKIEDPISKLDEVDGITDFKIRRSCIHGDLNLQNILFTTITDDSGKESFNFWLIDFADTTVGPTCFDFIKMEVEIRLQLLSRVLFNKKMEHRWEKDNFDEVINYFIDCERDLNSSIFKSLSENDSTKIWHNDEDIAKYYLVISHLRQIAGEFGITKIEYFIMLYYYSLVSLKFDEVEMDQIKNPSAPLPRIMAYFTSAVAYEFIKMEHNNEK